MTKDPAFLFYSTDFYEGTRMMLPEERACYLDLLIYQHQNGIIPNDLKRLKMYCSGVEEATLKATLEAKFKQTPEGWHNQKLKDVVSDRSDYKSKQSQNGSIGQFWKKCKAFLPAGEYKTLRKTLENVDKNEVFNFLKNKKIEEDTLRGLLKALLKHLEIEDENEIENRIKIENEVENEVENDKNAVGKKNELFNPFPGKEFLEQWQIWKDYKKREFKFNYKSLHSEQAALKQLYNYSKGDSQTAIEILLNSMANGWAGFFELKNSNNGNRNNNYTRTDAELKQSAGNAVDKIFGKQ